jgi:hypothetical protein
MAWEHVIVLDPWSIGANASSRYSRKNKRREKDLAALFELAAYFLFKLSLHEIKIEGIRYPEENSKFGKEGQSVRPTAPRSEVRVLT